jgi:hypothetical protein
MSDPMQHGMAEAMRLTQQGRLAEATAIIQRTLGGTFAPAPGGTDVADETGEAARRTINETARPEAPPRPEPARKHALRPAPRQPRGFRGMEFPLGDLPGTMPRPAEVVPASIVVPAGEDSSNGPTPIGPGPVPTSCTSRAATSGRRCLWSSCSTAALRTSTISLPAPT